MHRETGGGNMRIDRETIRWVARLARLRLSPEEERSIESHLGSILEYMDILGELDLERVEPTAHTLGYTNRTRKDELEQSFRTETVALLAPRWARDHVVVPRVV
jgi:aspartyl-tRNA(Asn)/glutamyl-tRNA(Gln) amidotransferase subunit C